MPRLTPSPIDEARPKEQFGRFCLNGEQAFIVLQ